MGYESECEYLDLELADAVDADQVAHSVSNGLPEGIHVTGAVALADRAPALQEVITSLAYRATVTGADAPVIAAAVAEFNARPEIRVTVTRKGQDSIDDIRPSVLALTASSEAPVIEIEVVTKPRTLRVADVVTGLRTMSTDAETLAEGLVVRTHQWIEHGGTRHEPLDVDRRSPASRRGSGISGLRGSGSAHAGGVRVISKGRSDVRRAHRHHVACAGRSGDRTAHHTSQHLNDYRAQHTNHTA